MHKLRLLALLAVFPVIASVLSGCVAAVVGGRLGRSLLELGGNNATKNKRVVRRGDKPTSGPAREAGAPA